MQKKIAECQEQLRSKLGYEPTPEEIAEELCISVRTIKNALMEKPKIASFDSLYDKDDKRSTFISNFPDERVDVENEIIALMEYEEVMQIILQKLTTKEAYIFLARRGLFSEPKKLRELAEEFHVKQQAIGSIEKKAEKK